MKKLSPILCALLFILAAHGAVYAQDFTVTVPSTDACGHYITPIKAGGSHQFQINVTNNRADTCTVSIDKSLMGTVSSWVSIENSFAFSPRNQNPPMLVLTKHIYLNWI